MIISVCEVHWLNTVNGSKINSPPRCHVPSSGMEICIHITIITISSEKFIAQIWTLGCRHPLYGEKLTSLLTIALVGNMTGNSQDLTLVLLIHNAFLFCSIKSIFKITHTRHVGLHLSNPKVAVCLILCLSCFDLIDYRHVTRCALLNACSPAVSHLEIANVNYYWRNWLQ